MSMPKFPEVNPDLTSEQALNMILASIAMEELALSHIINAEGEKLQFALGMLKSSGGKDPSISEVLAVNQSINSLLDSISQNQMILKSKMDKALCALESVLPGRPGPTGPPGPPGLTGDRGPAGPAGKCYCKCSALFRNAEKYHFWCAGSALCWKPTHLFGECVYGDPCDKTIVNLCGKGRFMLSFAVNVKAESGCQCDVAISLQMINNYQRTDIYTAYDYIAEGRVTTISMSGIIIETDHYEVSSLLLNLVSDDSLIVKDSMLSITEI